MRAAKQGAAGSDLKILAVTILTSLDRQDLDASLIKPGQVSDLVQERAGLAFDAGADGVDCQPAGSIPNPWSVGIRRKTDRHAGCPSPLGPLWATRNESQRRKKQ